MDKSREENEDRVAEEYLSSLSDLNCNSKPLINMLTMLAEENIEYARVIVKVVEQHINKVPPDIKLPLLYLIDSIVKNVKGTYVQLFSQCIVNIFCSVFEKVNEKIRERMYSLRQTWNEVFTPQKLYALDVKVKCIDNNWPITAKQPQPSIHVNPNFLKTVGGVRGGDVEEILHAKTMELLELRKRKLELELEATKKHLEEQEKQLTKATDGVIAPVKGLVDPSSLTGLRGVPMSAAQMVPGIVASGLLPPHHMNAGVTTAGVMSGSIAPGLYHHNYRNPRPHSHSQPPHATPGVMTMPSQNYQPVTAGNKPKVHPVNPALLNSIRHRDPRLARQQQQTQVHQTNRNMQMHSIRNDNIQQTEDDVSVEEKSQSQSFRNRGGKSNDHNNAAAGDGNSGAIESKSLGRQSSSSSSRFTSHVSKSSSSSRDKDKNRKRSESKSSTTSSSSVGSTSSERRKGSASNSSRNKKNFEKCDKDAFEIASLSTAFKRKSVSPPSSSPSKRKEFKRANKLHNHVESKYSHSRSRSPFDVIAKDVDLRSRTSPPTDQSPKDSRRKNSISESSDHDEEDQNATKSTKGLENKNIKIVLDTIPAIATDIDLRRLPSTTSYSSIAKQCVAPTTTCVTTVATSSPKVSFKIQKLFNKLDKSTEHAARTTTTTTTTENVVETSSNLMKSELKTEPEKEGNIIKDESNHLSDESHDDKKRILSMSTDPDEPLAKKSKSTKLDALFGDEDVDLRTVMMPSAQMLASHSQTGASATTGGNVSPPPPPVITHGSQGEEDNWTNSKALSLKAEKTSPKKSLSNLEDVRAKLAKATKYNKLGKSDKIRLNFDDLRVNEDSLEANDEKIRTIIAQAQELLENKSINQEQYKNLMQKVMSINESSKLKEAKRRELLNNVSRAKGSSTGVGAETTGSSSIEMERMAAREAILKKRIPKLPRGQQQKFNDTSHSLLVANSNSNSNSPLYTESETIGNQKSKVNKEKRNKPSKWGERIDPSHGSSSISVSSGQNLNSQKGWLKGSAMKQQHAHAHPSGGGFRGGIVQAPMANANIQQQQQMPWQIGANISSVPFINPMTITRQPNVPLPANPSSHMPPALVPPAIPKPCNSIDNPKTDLVRTITIDGLSKEIRIYDQVAIVFMELDQPREIGFQAGQRSIIIDNEDPITLQFNDDYKTFLINGEPHRLRFGFPSRELYIDEHWYEIYFGGPPVSIPINNKIHILKAEGPPPQVNIGVLRRDLVVGKINMIVDAHIVIPLFLDAKIQTFRLGENEHTVQFADCLLTVLLDGKVVNVEFGGLPRSYTLQGKTYFIRFGALPQGVVAGKIKIKDMIYVKIEKPVDHFATTIDVENTTETSVLPTTTALDAMVKQPPLETEQPNNQPNEMHITTSTLTSSGEAEIVNPSIPIIPTAALSNINIDELFQKLVSSGILSGAASAPATKAAGGMLPSATAATKTAVVDDVNSAPPVVCVCPIDLTKTETIKTRQAAVVNTLFSGMQCSSCGVRFPPEQTIKYSQHLDWHFRQNRRERDSSRKAHSRKWYYDLADWVQYEEIEDLEEREKNFFETQLTDVDTNDDTSNQRWPNSPVPSCPAMPEDVDRACDMCHEKFEQFYNEELEEWHLRSAIRVKDKIYHPLCYEDYKASLIPVVVAVDKEDCAASKENVDDKNAVDVDAIIKIEVDDKSEETKVDNGNDDYDDDVIVLPNEEPTVTEIDDDDEYIPVNVTREEMGDVVDDDKSEEGGLTDTAGSDVEIQEPNIPFTDLDTYEEKPQSEGDESSQMSFMNVKIKEEPKDDDDYDDDDDFEDVGTVLIAPEEEISIQSSEETLTQTIVSSISTSSPPVDRPPSATSIVQLDATEFSEAAVNADHSTSMDGNLEAGGEHNLSAVGPAPAIPLASLVNKIKINIAKNSASTNHNSSSNSNNSTASACAATSSATTAATTAISFVNHNNTNEVGLSNSAAENSSTSAISVVSTIPVLCGGGTTGGATRSTIATTSSSGSGGASASASDTSSVSTISVIGGYSNSIPNNNSTQSRHFVDAVAPAPPRPRTPPIEDTITYELKPSLQKVSLTKAKKVESGVETSGLCSLM